MELADSTDAAQGAGFWLPSEFFDDFLTDKENFRADSDSEFFFPTEFPYDFETQSTLDHAGSWSSGRSKDAVEDLISKLKLHGADVTRPTKHSGLLPHPRTLDQLRPAPTTNPNHSAFQNVYLQQQHIAKQSGGIWYSEPQMYPMRSGREMGQGAWLIHHQNPTRIVGSGHTAVLSGGSVGGGGGGGGAAVKRKSAGTGVFLPRRYGNINDSNAHSDSRKKPGYSALNKNVDNMNGFVQYRPHCHPDFAGRLNPNYEMLMARRNALMFATPANFATRRLLSDGL
ncbi:hypothetical protein ABFS82_06G128800 [Erythranthe guttata]|nr:PREDICTED: uncharacterized protein LOC105960427 [Erythranthe guttata]|eukprot:XP_012840053.1 PREDICTED: uncharacterized protein LOC105960427 [Erythranthe guttata]